MAFDPFTVLSTERGVLRVFSGDLLEEGDVTPETAHVMLGQGLDLDPEKIDVFPPTALQPIGMAEYLSEGHGIPQQELDSESLDALRGLVIVVPSSAFRGRAAHLTLGEGMRLVGAYHEPRGAPPRSMAEPGPLEPPTAVASTTPQPRHTPWIGIWVIGLLVALVLWAVF